MRVLFINNFAYLRGGSERVLFEEIKLLKAASHEAAIFSRKNEKNQANTFAMYFPEDIVTDRIGFSIRSLKTLKEIVYSREAKNMLKRTVAEFCPNVAHAHNIYGRLSLSVLDALKELDIPAILTLHDYKLLCPSYLMLNHGVVCDRCKSRNFLHALITRCHKNSYAASAVYAFESWFNHTFGKYDGVSYFISPSHFLLKKVIEFGIPPEKIVYIPNFIDHRSIKAVFERGQYFLFFGRLSHEKGVDTLLEAFTSLRGNAQLVIVGDGPMRRELEATAVDAGDRVRFTGYLSGKTLQDTISQAKAVVMPSEWNENAPLTLLEAFAHGKLVIGSRIGGIPEMIDDGIDGFLFEPGNVEDLQEKIELVLNLPDSGIREMGMAAREKAEREYNTELHYERLMALYNKVLEKA